MSRTTEVIDWAIGEMSIGLERDLPDVDEGSSTSDVMSFFTAGDRWILERCGLDPEGVLPFAMAQAEALVGATDVQAVLRAHGLRAVIAMMGAAFMQGIVVGSIAAEKTKGADQHADA